MRSYLLHKLQKEQRILQEEATNLSRAILEATTNKSQQEEAICVMRKKRTALNKEVSKLNSSIVWLQELILY